MNTDDRYSLSKKIYPPDKRCTSGRHKDGTGGCMRPRVDGKKFCREHIIISKRASEARRRREKFTPDFVADPSLLPKRPPGAK